MHIAITLSLATIGIVVLLAWGIFALIRAHFRRQRRIRRELKEMKRIERNEKIAGRFRAIKAIAKRS